MNPRYEHLTQELQKCGIRLSKRRLQVVEFLCKNLCHPTVEQIYTGLQTTIPSLSKTTIYNTIKLLENNGLLRVLKIEDNETRYDIVTANHGHFKCQKCGVIYNFEIDLDPVPTQGLSQFHIASKDVYFQGTCLKCLININKKE
jgi:Fe2+ or Zn2+ uptake regulation protein